MSQTSTNNVIRPISTYPYNSLSQFAITEFSLFSIIQVKQVCKVRQWAFLKPFCHGEGFGIFTRLISCTKIFLCGFEPFLEFGMFFTFKGKF